MRVLPHIYRSEVSPPTMLTTECDRLDRVDDQLAGVTANDSPWKRYLPNGPQPRGNRPTRSPPSISARILSANATAMRTTEFTRATDGSSTMAASTAPRSGARSNTLH
ncbi:hypothetical protein PSAB6_100198 [Paraburkholderia sabiae]|nr:hypothetical protein PSAB6_100198 [Paraburkholderia sabiae]